MTLKEVAERAGVSIATASRALNKPGVVQDVTRRRVLQAVKELHYRPNRFAQSLAGGRTNALGVIVSNIENPFFLDILHALEEEATRKGFELIYENTDYRPERLAGAVERMLGRPLAGLALIVSERDDEAVAMLEDWNQPVVLFDSVHTPPVGVTIELRYEKAMQRTVEYLYSLGHRRMAFIGHHSALDPLRERENAFMATVSGFPDVESATAASNDSLAGGRQAMQQLLASGFDPTAVMCANDFMAVGVLRELREAGLRTPEDVSVTGFDNIELSEYLYPALTTVNIPRQRIGQLIFHALVPGESGQPSRRPIVIEPELVLRDSTAPPRR
ncbi:MAG: LacI family DNA-binding transcriptional regulator [Acidobacteria bacterium]|nr:LacI family DNA-binding transcriptional regulator [Acidobacteriota bacterium]